MFGITGPVVYLLIFIGKLAEVSLMTLRIVFVGRGMKLLSALCGLIEEVLWVIVVSAVLSSIRTDPLAAVMYCAAFTVGIVLGIVIENRLAIGITSMQIVSMAADGDKVGPALREHDFGVTVHISRESAQPLETGGGIRHAAPYLSGDRFLVHNVDILSDLDVRWFIR